MAIFNTVWSLDVGRSSLKAVKLRRDKSNIEILAVDKIDYSAGADGIDFASQAKEALAAFRVRNDVRDPVIVAHHGQGTLSRFIKLPAFDPKKIHEMVGYEAAQQIPFPLDEVIWDYHVIDRDYMPGEEREVGLFAARREAIDDYLLDFESEGLSVEGLTIGYLGLLNFILYDVAPEEPTIFLDIGASHTDLILVDGKKFWTRALPHSGNDINKAIMSRFKLNFAEAERLKLQSAKNQQQAVKIFKSVIQPKLRDLVNEVHRSVGYYRTQSGEVQFKQLYLLGNGSKILGIKKFLEEHLGLQVERLDSIGRLRINREANLQLLQGNLPAFGTAFGSALQGVGVGSCRVDLLPQEEKVQKEWSRKKKHVYIALAVLYLATLLGGYVIHNKVDDARSYADEVTSLLRPVDRAKKDLAKVEEGDVSAEAAILASIAELRNMPINALDIVAQVIGSVPDAEYVAEAVKKQEPVRSQALADMKGKVGDSLQRKVWIPWLDIEKVEWPEDPDSRSRSRRRSRSDDRPTVPAYKVSLFAVVKEQANPTASLNLIRERVSKPIGLKLRTLERDDRLKGAKVVVSDDFKKLNQILYKSEITSKETQDVVQDGAPFFGTEISWYMRVEDPPEPVAEEDEDK